MRLFDLLMASYALVLSVCTIAYAWEKRFAALAKLGVFRMWCRFRICDLRDYWRNADG